MSRDKVWIVIEVLILSGIVSLVAMGARQQAFARYECVAERMESGSVVCYRYDLREDAP